MAEGGGEQEVPEGVHPEAQGALPPRGRDAVRLVQEQVGRLAEGSPGVAQQAAALEGDLREASGREGCSGGREDRRGGGGREGEEGGRGASAAGGGQGRGEGGGRQGGGGRHHGSAGRVRRGQGRAPLLALRVRGLGPDEPPPGAALAGARLQERRERPGAHRDPRDAPALLLQQVLQEVLRFEELRGGDKPHARGNDQGHRRGQPDQHGARAQTLRGPRGFRHLREAHGGSAARADAPTGRRRRDRQAEVLQAGGASAEGRDAAAAGRRRPAEGRQALLHAQAIDALWQRRQGRRIHVGEQVRRRLWPRWWGARGRRRQGLRRLEGAAERRLQGLQQLRQGLRKVSRRHGPPPRRRWSPPSPLLSPLKP
mmetsp:Transcript_49828/g.155937  ORF Transcript_49828/g.155937 Transcript_49828/m.155937 type:complete len:370 (-) Transcript_49828:2-1111(-)